MLAFLRWFLGQTAPLVKLGGGWKLPAFFNMALTTTNDKWTAVRALINTLLKDKTIYCNTCGQDYSALTHPCCNEPHMGTNEQFVKLIIEQNKLIKSSRKNDLAQTDDKSMRWGLSMPPRFLQMLENAYRVTYGGKLFEDNKDLHAFMREFKPFTICEKI